MTERYDTIVIGGGSGGMAYATEAASLGARVLLIEKSALGGTCVNRGCVPKKLLWKAAYALSETQAIAGREAGQPASVAFGALMARIAEKIDDIRESHSDRLADAGVARLDAEARIDADRIVHADGRRFDCDRLVIATGARPQNPDIEGIALADTSDAFFAWTDLPRSVAILGGGYIGCEFASILTSFGVACTLIDRGEAILDGFDADLVSAAQDQLAARGVTLRLEADTTRIEKADDGFAVHLSEGDPIRAERVIAAVGRAPNVDGLGPISDDLRRADSGALAIDARLETNLSGVHAIGDAADRLPLTPVATRDGEALARILFGEGAELIDLDLVAATAFLMPPIAEVGATTEGDASTGKDLMAGALTGNDAAIAATLHKLAIADGALRGAALMSESAPEAIGLFGTLIAAGATPAHLREATAIHPSFIEELIGRD